MLGWIIFRLVQYPPFVEFLIATEAEMNKVSWTSRDDLYRATSVVLTTVLLMAVYLFGVDWVWSNLLQLIGVLRFGERLPLRLDGRLSRGPTSPSLMTCGLPARQCPRVEPRWPMVETSGRISATDGFPEMCSKYFGLRHHRVAPHESFDRRDPRTDPPTESTEPRRRPGPSRDELRHRGRRTDPRRRRRRRPRRHDQPRSPSPSRPVASRPRRAGKAANRPQPQRRRPCWSTTTNPPPNWSGTS